MASYSRRRKPSEDLPLSEEPFWGSEELDAHDDDVVPPRRHAWAARRNHEAIEAIPLDDLGTKHALLLPSADVQSRAGPPEPNPHRTPAELDARSLRPTYSTTTLDIDVEHIPADDSNYDSQDSEGYGFEA
eukprot:m.18376 g.18376  ORF g.18376 m.18376 type:complete len:131 (+) comp10796_c0_seq2:3-395(+)